MATRFLLHPDAAEVIGSAFPQISRTNDRPVLWYDASTNESACWTCAVPAGITGAMTLVLSLICATATSGSHYWQASVEAVTDGDALDLDATTSFDTANTGNLTAAATAGYMKQLSITITNADSVAAADYVRIRITRDASNGSDTASGDVGLLMAEFRDAA